MEIVDRWSLGGPEEMPLTPDCLGDHTAARYRRFHRFTQSLGKEEMDDELFGLVLSASSVCDELRAYEHQASWLVRLAQSAHFVRQLCRLNAVLDAVGVAYEPEKQMSWKDSIDHERSIRAAWYGRILASFDADVPSTVREQLVDEINSDNKAAEVLTLLKAAGERYGPEGLTAAELILIEQFFGIVTELSGMVVMTIPTWFALPFEFGSTFGLSRWGNDRFFQNHADEERLIKEASLWSDLNHPHVAKFLGACHVGNQPFIAHEKIRTLGEFVLEVKDRQALWRRVYEASLALQYILEQGFSCPDIRAEQIYCAQFEGRTVFLGVHFRSVMVHSNERCRAVFDDSAAQALIYTILDLLQDVSEVKHQCPNCRPSTATKFRPLPCKCTLCLDDNEWILINSLKDPKALRQRGIEHIVEKLGEFAGVEEIHKRLAYIPTFLRQVAKAEGNLDFIDLQVTLGGETIGEILLKTQAAIATTNLSLHRLQKRFVDVCAQLRHENQWLKSLTIVAHLACQLRELLNVVSFQASFGSDIQSDQCNQCQKGASEHVFSLHTKLDQFMVLNQLSMTSEVHSWLPEWNALWLTASPTSPRSLAISPERYQHNEAHASRWFIPREHVDFDLLAPFSEGSFGSVHHGKWFGTPVVVKRVKQMQAETMFRQEADVWFQLNHINVIKMYGACDIGDHFFVCEYASGGDLDKYFQVHGRNLGLMWYCLLNAALGLQYLHDNGIVHADLKANNILVGADGVAKLTDFGLSVKARGGEGGGEASGNVVGAFRWKAPECLSGSQASYASDVYSFAMVIIEVISGSYPWGDNMPDAGVTYLVKKGHLPSKPPAIQDAEWDLIKKMCAIDPNQRVTVDAVVVHLSSLLQKLDQRDLWSPPDRGARMKIFRNRFMSRHGALLSLVELAKGKSPSVAAYASDQVVLVSMSRGATSEQQELSALLRMLADGSDDEKAWAIHAIAVLNKDNTVNMVSESTIQLAVTYLRNGTLRQKMRAASALTVMAISLRIGSIVAAAGGIAALVTLLRCEDDSLKESAARAIRNLVWAEDICAEVISAGGIEPLVDLLRKGNDTQQLRAAAALRNIAARAEISEQVVSSGGIPVLVGLVRDGSEEQKTVGAGALCNLSTKADIGTSVISAGGILPLIELIRHGNDEQKTVAAGALGNVSARTDISGFVAAAGGIPLLVDLAHHGKDAMKMSAATALSKMVDKADISNDVISAGGIAAFVHLLRDENIQLKMRGLVAIKSIAARVDISESLAAEGGVSALVDLARDGNKEQKTISTAAVTCMFNANAGANGMFTGSLVGLMRQLHHGSQEQKLLATVAITNTLSN